MQERFEELGLSSGKAPSTSGTQDVVKNLTDAEDQAEESVVEGVAGGSSNKMIHHNLDDSTIKFEMAMVIPDMCKPTVGVTVSWTFELDKHSVKPGLLVDADGVSDESMPKSLSLGEAEFYVLNLGCAAESFVMHCWKGMQMKHPTLTYRPEIDSDSSTARGAAKRSGNRRGKHTLR